MSLNQPETNSATPHEDGDDGYVDPILFAEGIYADQNEYERVIDDFAERINNGQSTPRGREPKLRGRLSELLVSDTADYVSLQRAVSRLDAKFRIVIELRYLHDFEYSEIAKELNISPAQATARLANAIRALRAELASSGGPSEPPPIDVAQPK